MRVQDAKDFADKHGLRGVVIVALKQDETTWVTTCGDGDAMRHQAANMGDAVRKMLGEFGWEPDEMSEDFRIPGKEPELT